MRNAIKIEGNLVITTDNSGGIGEKKADVVAVPDRLTAYYAARVALLELWTAHAKPIAILLQNFSGETSWSSYVQGIEDLFQEAELEMPEITGSTETNMVLLQSAVAVTMIGKCEDPLPVQDVTWFTYGRPLVGDEVKMHSSEIAAVLKVKQALAEGIVSRIWPVGSAGILQETRRMLGRENLQVVTRVDAEKSAGPSTVILLAVPRGRIEEAERFFESGFYALEIID